MQDTETFLRDRIQTYLDYLETFPFTEQEEKLLRREIKFFRSMLNEVTSLKRKVSFLEKQILDC